MGEPRWEVDGNGVTLVGSKRGVHADIHCHAQTLQASNDLAQQVADALNRLPAITAERDAFAAENERLREMLSAADAVIDTMAFIAKGMEITDD